MDYLKGGRPNQIIRNKNIVHRPAGAWSKTIQSLLAHIRAEGFLDAPEPLGFDNDGNEMVSFLSGEVSNYPLSETAVSPQALISAAKLLRAYHDTTLNFPVSDQQTWMLPPRQPAEVICHGDFAPYNVVLQGKTAVGIIDFDTAHPAPRTWDIAYALYRWSPLTNPKNDDGFGNLSEQISRAHLFCDSYGLPLAQRKTLPLLIIERLQTLVDLMQIEAKKGNATFQANLDEGHHLLYLADIAYIKTHQAEIRSGLLG